MFVNGVGLGIKPNGDEAATVGGGGGATGCINAEGLGEGVPPKGDAWLTNRLSGLFSAPGSASVASSKMVLYITKGRDCVVRFRSTSFPEKDWRTRGEGTYFFLLFRSRYGSGTAGFPSGTHDENSKS